MCKGVENDCDLGAACWRFCCAMSRSKVQLTAPEKAAVKKVKSRSTARPTTDELGHAGSVIAESELRWLARGEELTAGFDWAMDELSAASDWSLRMILSRLLFDQFK